MLILIAAVFFSFYFIEIAGIPNWIKAKLKFPKGKRLKPLDCFICLSVWVAAALYFFPEVAHFVAVTFGAGIISNVIAWMIRK